MKKFFLLAALLLSMVTAASAQPQSSPPSSPQSSIIKSVTDSADLLSADQEQALTEKVQSLETKHGVRIGVVTLKSARGLEIKSIADNLLDDYFSGGRNGSIALIVIMDTRQWYISTDAQMKRRITTEDGIPYLKEQFVSEMTSGNFYAAFNNYVNSIDQMLAYYEQNEAPYGHRTGIAPEAVAGAFIVGLITMFMVRSSMIAAMSNVHQASEAGDYLDKNSINVIDARDMFLFSHVTRQSKSRGRSSGGGGGSGGGHGGGGGSF